MKESPWRINVARLTEAKELSLELGEEWFAHWVSEDPELEFTGPGQLTGVVHVEKHGKDVLVRGHLKGGLTLVCGRCLTSYEASLAADFDLLLAPGPGALKAEEELKAGDLDLDFYSGDVVDLEPIIREQILLALPLKPVCSEGCKGLCPRCGADLNKETCACPAEKAASPFAELAKLKK